MITINEEQRAIVTSAAPAIIVGAGPGSGKTTTIVSRIAARVAAGADEEKIAIISFSNSAAKVFTERLEKVGIEVGYAGTLHGYMLKNLNRYGSLIGYRAGQPLTILNEEARAQMLRETAERLGFGKLSQAAIERNEDRKAQMVNKEYAFAVKRSQMIDYDGILSEGLKLIWKLNTPSIGDLDPLEELLVDEVQDCAAIDWDIIDAIPAAVKTVVGDDLQSLYRFRGARPELFVERAKVGKFFTLEHNYRSDRAICQAANALIAHNTGQLPKIIRPVSEAIGAIKVIPIEHSRDEGSRVLLSLRRQNAAGTPWAEMAVLARTNAIVDEIRDCLLRTGVPLADSGRPSLPADWSLCMTALQLMQDPRNNILCEQYLKGRMIAAVVVNRIKMEALKAGAPMSWLAAKQNVCAVEIADPVKNVLDVAVRLSKLGMGHESIDLVFQRIQALPGKKPALADLLADLFNPDDWDSTAKTSGVFVCTAHRAKGQEWDFVIVAGMEEGVMPSLSKSSDLAEERRICFVCVTRARHRLELMWCANRFQYGKASAQTASRFIEEITNTK
jgi:superfamily I DNA/RNA helicase